MCTPIGSTFSIEQMITQLSARSRITSSSYSFHPAIDSSTRISPIGLDDSPLAAIRSNSSGVAAMPVPRPPRMYAGRMITGSPMSATTLRASSMSRAVPERGTSRPISTIATLNFSRSSAVAIASASAPIISGRPGTPISPRSYSSIATFNPVWPPSVGSTASGCSRSMIASSTSHVSGSTYVASAKSGSVMIVAGFELARITR